MNDNVLVDEALSRQGWSVFEDGYDRRFERDGLTLSYDGHWSVQKYFVSSLTGGWGDMQEIMSKIGLLPIGDERDFLSAAKHRQIIKAYLDSPEWKNDIRKARHGRMDHLREFQRSIGMEESWLEGEEDGARRKAAWALQLGGWNGLKCWVAAAISLAYLAYKIVVSDAKIPLVVTVAAGSAIMMAGLYAMRRQNKI